MTIGSRDFFQPGRSVAVGDRGMAATSHPQATLVAVDIMRAGGNAIDAAIAAVAVQCVIDPHMTGIGGDCFAIYAPAGGRMVAINGSGRAPAAATLDWYRERGLGKIEEDTPHAVTVPGAIDAWCRLSEDHGRLGLDRVLAPAIAAAEEGFIVTPRVAYDWAMAAKRFDKSAGKAVYLPNGKAPAIGDKLYHPALGATLRKVARMGRSAFYEGEVAEEIASTLQSLGGLMQPEDLTESRPDYVSPISAAYRDHRLWECPPNGQGITALTIVRILDGFDMADAALSEADRIHLLAEATKAAYRQRDTLIGDPDVTRIDVDALLSDAAIAKFRRDIDLRRVSKPVVAELPRDGDTIYLTVADRDGNLVSFINSLFSAFGSGVYAPRSGVLLQCRGAAFSLLDGHPNAIGPRKRPLHTIIPAMLTRDDKPVMAYGVMGGQYQATGHAQILTSMLDRGFDIQQASDHPRSFAFDGELLLEKTVAPDVADNLSARGHVIRWADAPRGGYQAIYIDHSRGLMFGASDHRKDGIALAA